MTIYEDIDTPILNTQEELCVSGEASTSCIFYGKEQSYLGTEPEDSFYNMLNAMVGKLIVGNTQIVSLEEENRNQQDIIEALQVSISDSLVNLAATQVLLDACCPLQPIGGTGNA